MWCTNNSTTCPKSQWLVKEQDFTTSSQPKTFHTNIWSNSKMQVTSLVRWGLVYQPIDLRHLQKSYITSHEVKVQKENKPIATKTIMILGFQWGHLSLWPKKLTGATSSIMRKPIKCCFHMTFMWIRCWTMRSIPLSKIRHLQAGPPIGRRGTWT